MIQFCKSLVENTKFVLRPALITVIPLEASSGYLDAQSPFAVSVQSPGEFHGCRTGMNFYCKTVRGTRTFPFD
jgi:hypothetical protein